MKKIALQKLVEAAEACEKAMKGDIPLDKKELFSRAYAQITDIIEEMVSEKKSD